MDYAGCYAGIERHPYYNWQNEPNPSEQEHKYEPVEHVYITSM